MYVYRNVRNVFFPFVFDGIAREISIRGGNRERRAGTHIASRRSVVYYALSINGRDINATGNGNHFLIKPYHHRDGPIG